MRAALITGGTSGIGLAFAQALARRGVALVLVARDADRLGRVADELTATHGVRVDTLVADLADRSAQDAVAARLASDERLDVLVNNAGFSLKTPLVGGDEALLDRGYEVMGRALRVLGGAAGAAFRARGGGTIINVTSLSGMTRQDGYSALKAYGTALTEVLANELTGTGVTVTAVLPGWVRTDFHAAGGVGKSSIPDVLWLDADRVAADALADAARGKVLSVPAKRYRALAFLLGALPPGGVRAVSRALSGHRRRGAASAAPAPSASAAPAASDHDPDRGEP